MGLVTGFIPIVRGPLGKGLSIHRDLHGDWNRR